MIWRFGQHSIHRLGAFNGDPHPGNYRFHHDGSVTFLDFGLVKRWEPGEWERLEPSLDAIVVHRDPERLVAAMEHVRVPRRRATASIPTRVYDYVSSPYRPYLVDEFTFTRDWMRETLGPDLRHQRPARRGDRQAQHAGRASSSSTAWCGASAPSSASSTSPDPWRAMLLEYRTGAPPATELGAAEAAWRGRAPG